MVERQFEYCPSLLHLIERFGALRVWKAGLELLRYPPTWAIGGNDVLELGLLLSQQGKDG